MFKSLLPATAAACALLVMPGTAEAHIKLTASTPAPNAQVSRANAITLKFNEKVIASTMTTELVMTRMPGMASPAPMKVPYSSAMGMDGKSMTLAPKRALAPGTYKVRWSAAGTDTHRMGSEFSFPVV